MKHKMIALILALTVMSWAQTATPTTPSTPQQSTAPAESGKSPCCDKMAGDTKDGQTCSAQMKHGDGKEMASCCASKDVKSCCDDKNAASCTKGD